MNWNWSRKTRLLIVGGAGVALILFGISEGVFHYWVPAKMANEISLFFMAVAAVVLLSGRGKDQQKQETDQTEEKETPPES